MMGNGDAQETLRPNLGKSVSLRSQRLSPVAPLAGAINMASLHLCALAVLCLVVACYGVRANECIRCR